MLKFGLEKGPRTSWFGALVIVTVVSCGCATKPTEPPQPHAPDVHQVSEPEDEVDAIDAMAARLIDDEWTVGLAVGLIADEQTQMRFYGSTEVGGNTPTEDTVFEVGSVTKVFTTTCLADAVLEDQVELSTTVDAILGRSGAPVGGPVGSRTLEQLATHTAGLPRIPPNYVPENPADPYAAFDEGRLRTFLEQVESLPEPAEPAYSNLGVGLLGYLLAQERGTSLAMLMEERLFAPLGMDSTSFEDAGPEVTARGYDGDGLAVPSWHGGALAGAGGVRSTLGDMMRFAEANLHPERHGPVGEALATTHEVRRPVEGPAPDLALGWHVGGAGIPQLRWHNGQTGGYHSFIAFDPEQQIAVVVLANQAAPPVDQLGGGAVAHLAGKPVHFELPEFLELPTETLERLAGRYQFEPDFAVTVTVEGSRLRIVTPGQPDALLYAVSETEFRLRAAPVAFRFELRDGEAVALVVDQGAVEQRAERKP